jgi:beta-glucosidase
MYYNLRSSRLRRRYVDMPPTLLWESGYGLSYTKFEYSKLQLSAREIGPRGSLQVSADVANENPIDPDGY